MATDLSGMRFGRLTVISRSDDKVSSSGYRTVMWRCICDCGVEKDIRAKCLTGGQSKSCGCLQRELIGDRARKHGRIGSRLYAIWNSMRQRCNNEKNRAYQNYGGRGIKICEEWDSFATFEMWALSNGYDENAERGEYTLDRIDVNKGYSPDNCRFEDMGRQANNKRDTVYYELDGVKLPLSDWARITGIKYCTLWARYKRGWSAERALHQ